MVLIRPFAADDAAEVNATALEAFAQYRNVYDDWDRLAQGVGAMASLADTGELIVAVVPAAGIVGAVAYFGPGSTPRAEFFEAHWAIIRMLVVRPCARRRGIGRRLTEECIARARRDGAPLVALHTSPLMEAALGMYLRMGFELVGRVPDRFGVPYGVYILNLRPPSAASR
jgi:ribosomal protein S18 acetylase RimI-like enzyme